MNDSTVTATAAQQFADFATGAFGHPLPDDVMAAARRQLTDSVGVALAAREESSVRSVAALVAHWGGKGEAAALGGPVELPAAHAALIGGTMAHALDFDDTHLPSVLHPSASVVPAALAVGMERDATIADVVRAVAVGNELVVRLGMAGYDQADHNSIFFARGFHATSICGAVGAAVAAGVLSGMSAPELCHAIAISSSFGAGLLEANRTGGTVKRAHCGWAAFVGVTARDLVQFGLTGPPTVFEGRFGFVEAFCGDRGRPEWVTLDLGSHWEMVNIGHKPYPTNGFTHAVIDAAVRLRERGFGPSDFTRVEVRLPDPVLRTVAEPREVKIRPASPYNARFSAPFVFALALRGGGGLGVAIDDFSDETIRDDTVLSLASRVDVVADDECSRAFPEEVPAQIVATTPAGDTVTESVRHRRGSRMNPLTVDQHHEKFMSNASRVLSDDAAAAIYHAINGDTDSPVTAFLEMTTTGGSSHVG